MKKSTGPVFAAIVFWVLFSCELPDSPTSETPADPSPPADATLVNVWKLESYTCKKADRSVLQVWVDPIDFLNMTGQSDSDNDGTIETYILEIFLKISDTGILIYEKTTLSDGGSETAQLVGAGFIDTFRYFTLMESSYTLNGQILTESPQSGGSITFTYDISGSKLTLSRNDDNGTAGNPADDRIHIYAYKVASVSDIQNAVSSNSCPWLHPNYPVY